LIGNIFDGKINGTSILIRNEYFAHTDYYAEEIHSFYIITPLKYGFKVIPFYEVKQNQSHFTNNSMELFYDYDVENLKTKKFSLKNDFNENNFEIIEIQLNEIERYEFHLVVTFININKEKINIEITSERFSGITIRSNLVTSESNILLINNSDYTVFKNDTFKFSMAYDSSYYSWNHELEFNNNIKINNSVYNQWGKNIYYDFCLDKLKIDLKIDEYGNLTISQYNDDSLDDVIEFNFDQLFKLENYDLISTNYLSKYINKNKYVLIIDTETNAKPKKLFNGEVIWPRLVEVGFKKQTEFGFDDIQESYLIKPRDFQIEQEAEEIHGISNEKANTSGYDIEWVLSKLLIECSKANLIIGYNIDFDINILNNEFKLNGFNYQIPHNITYCVMKNYHKNFQKKDEKWLKLSELYFRMFGEYMENKHRALDDVLITEKCYNEIKELKSND
jgi:DNA polymerase-3 subunit epsilon